MQYVGILLRALALRDTNKSILGKLYFFAKRLHRAVAKRPAEGGGKGARFARLAKAKPKRSQSEAIARLRRGINGGACPTMNAQ